MRGATPPTPPPPEPEDEEEGRDGEDGGNDEIGGGDGGQVEGHVPTTAPEGVGTDAASASKRQEGLLEPLAAGIARKAATPKSQEVANGPGLTGTGAVDAQGDGRQKGCHGRQKSTVKMQSSVRRSGPSRVGEEGNAGTSGTADVEAGRGVEDGGGRGRRRRRVSGGRRHGEDGVRGHAVAAAD